MFSSNLPENCIKILFKKYFSLFSVYGLRSRFPNFSVGLHSIHLVIFGLKEHIKTPSMIRPLNCHFFRIKSKNLEKGSYHVQHLCMLFQTNKKLNVWSEPRQRISGPQISYFSLLFVEYLPLNVVVHD